MLRPRLVPFLRQYPEIQVELVIDNGFTNIVEQQIDAGVHLGKSLSKDMIAVRIGPDWRFAVVGAPSYFERHSPPATPQELTDHSCINIRLPTAGNIYAWEFAKYGRTLDVRVDGQFTCNSVLPVLSAALDGLGLAYVPHDLAEPYLANGRLIKSLADWCPCFQGYYLYYPHQGPSLTGIRTAGQSARCPNDLNGRFAVDGNVALQLPAPLRKSMQRTSTLPGLNPQLASKERRKGWKSFSAWGSQRLRCWCYTVKTDFGHYR